VALIKVDNRAACRLGVPPGGAMSRTADSPEEVMVSVRSATEYSMPLPSGAIGDASGIEALRPSAR
jgi:hypothetical protein